MRVRWFIPAALLLASCSSQGRDAEREYEMVKSAAVDPRDLCAAASKVKQAYLSDGNEQAYKLWSVREFNDCAAARRGYLFGGP